MTLMFTFFVFSLLMVTTKGLLPIASVVFLSVIKSSLRLRDVISDIVSTLRCIM
ncbi:hypothetical protein RhiirC2_753588 [Rhizophagus irregularis]|uniref:Uncharacterized protein n=1 Tax=Rhizophagus irregularis TaxID=588596 RepID=A0A2N1MXK9_9GLOM|nr:hypothetical protein RhiirC2_753588 [Rhizophagus irregularis]